MAFHESANFPRLADGSSGGPGFNSIFLDAKGGAQTRLGRWDGARRQYNAASTVLNPEDAAELVSFYVAREGGLHGFRFKDWADYSTDSTGFGTAAWDDEIIGTGDGTETQFQLVKRYISGGVTRVRNIAKPVSGTVKSGLDSTEKTEGTHFTVDHATGIVTYSAAPTLGQQVKAGCQFDVPAHFGPGADQLLDITMQSFHARGMPNVPILEEMSPTQVNDEYPYGGAFEVSFSIPTRISILMGRCGALTPGAATDIILPPATSLDAGGPYFFLANLSGTHIITLKSGVTSVGTIGTNSTKTLAVFLSSGVRVWRAY